ncbi:MAG: acyltransferase [Lachnospiraceae bacterium]|nr:acyltransferase [Lachnospiraceae bacterium]
MKRNGKVDFLRFVFALFIMFLHFAYRPEIRVLGHSFYLGQRGVFGVRFFFILSGYLLAYSVERMSLKNECESGADSNGLIKDYYPFIVRKYCAYIKWYLPAFLLCVLLDGLQSGSIVAIRKTVSSVQNLLLLGSLGFSFDSQSIGYYVGASWFISALFLAQIILFPLMRVRYRLWSRGLAPIVFVFSLALYINGYLCDWERMIQAIFSMALGSMCYELAKVISRRSYKRWFCNFLRVIELLIYLSCIAYMCDEAAEGTEYGMMFVVAFGIVLSFLPQTQYGFFDHPFFNFLGKLSFPLYLLHVQVLYWADYILYRLDRNPPDHVKYPVLYVCAIVVSVGFYFLWECIGKVDWKRKWKHLTEEK